MIWDNVNGYMIGHPTSMRGWYPLPDYVVVVPREIPDSSSHWRWTHGWKDREKKEPKPRRGRKKRRT